MATRRPICVKCRQHYRPKKNGVVWEEGVWSVATHNRTMETWQPRLYRDLSREDAQAIRKRHPNRKIIRVLIEHAVDGSNAGIA